MTDPHDAKALRAGGARRLAGTLALVTAYMGVEVAGGLLSGSLALLADAGHMLTDAASLALALFAARLAGRQPTARRTYGFQRAEILAALANGALLVAVAGWILVEAVGRLSHPVPVQGPLMLAVATGGLIVNAASLRLLSHHEDASLNEKGARLHVLSDLLGSLQAIAAGAIVWAFGATWVDPVASLLISLFVVRSAWGVLRESVSVLMESAPAHVDVDAVRAAMLSVDGVSDVHDLHVWSVTTGLAALSAHVGTTPDASTDAVRGALRSLLRERFGLDHLTLEVACGPCADEHPH